MAYRMSIAAAFVAVSLTGCASPNTGSNAASSNYVSDAPQRIAAADWSKAQTVTVSLASFHFAPDRLEFLRDAPYRLHLVNQSSARHTFTSEAFFKAIAVKQIEPGALGGTAPSSGTIALASGEEKDLYFVAVAPGKYDFNCSEFLHDTFGMTGEITIR